MTENLSEGKLLDMCKGATVEKPILQVLGYKKIAGSSSDRYRLFISDGRYSNSFAMLATQMNDKVVSGQLNNNCIIEVNSFVCNSMQNKRIIILLEISILKSGEDVGKKIGDPVQINADGTVNSSKNDSGAQGGALTGGAVKRDPPEGGLKSPPAKRSPLTASENTPKGRSAAGVGHQQTTDPNDLHISPIASLSPYQNRWAIKVRVTNKSDIRRWSNSKGEGHLFSIDLLDQSGEIRATLFKEQCDKFFNLIEVGKLYIITSCSLKPANKQFNTLNNDYELTFRDSTEVIPCNEDSTNIPTLSFDFVKIEDLSKFDKDSTADVIGVCKSASDPQTITSQRLQKEFVKRDVTLIDQSKTEVNLTLWGTTAETFDPSNNPVVAIKGARVSDFNGVSLSAQSSSVLQINPDLPQAHTLKGWYESEGSSVEAHSLTQSGPKAANMNANLKTFGEVAAERIGTEGFGKPEYFSATGYITLIMKDKALYQGCSRVNDGKTCNKKVIDQNNGLFRCEKCNAEITDPIWRLILNMSIADMTGQVWATCFQEQAETILGMSAQELGTLFSTDIDKYGKVFQDAAMKEYNFRLSSRLESYNEEQKVRHTVRSVVSVDCKEKIKSQVKSLEENGIPLPDGFNKQKYF